MRRTAAADPRAICGVAALLLLCGAYECDAMPMPMTLPRNNTHAAQQYLHAAHAGGLRRLASREATDLFASSNLRVSELGLDGLSSSEECKPAGMGSNPDPILCQYKNLLLWKGNFHYVLPVGVDVPPRNWMLRHMQYKGARVLKSVSEVGLSSDSKAADVALAALLTPADPYNYLAVFGQMLPTVYTVLCKHFGQCGHDTERQLQLIVANAELVAPEDAAVPLRSDWTSCLTPQPALLRNGSALGGGVLLLRSAFMLFDPSCADNGAECAQWDYRSPPAKDPALREWRDVLAACLPFDAGRTASFAPLNIVVVDRDYWAGRHILNVNEMLRNLRDRYPMANVTVAYPDRLPLAQQARVYNDASVLIWVTGASMANLLFAPHGAVVMHMGMKEKPARPYEWTSNWVETGLPHSLELHHCVTKNPDRIILRSYWVYHHPEYALLTDDEKLAVWEVKVCPGSPGSSINSLCEEVWIAKGGEFEMEFGFLWDAMDTFMPRLVQEHNQAKAAS